MSISSSPDSFEQFSETIFWTIFFALNNHYSNPIFEQVLLKQSLL